MTEELLSTLHKQRASAKGNITRIKKFLEDRRETLNTIDLECRLEILNSYIKQLMAYQTEIEKISPDDRRAELEEICITTKTLLLTQMGSCRPSMSHDTTFSAPLPPANRLPHLKIPKFTGKYSEYRNFIACFNNLVHDDPTLTKIEKFNHLIASLQDDALRTVKAFQVNENNYESALARLAERYDNKCLIFQDHIASLFNLKKIVRPNAPELRQTIDTVSAVLDSLSHLGSEKDIMNAIVIHLVLSKVDADTKAKWDENLDYRKLPQWKDCASILIRRCQFLELNEEKAFKGENGQNRFGREKLNGKGKKPQFALACTQVHTNECYFCSGMDHLIGSCPMFLAFKVSQRFDYIKRKGLCINCLKYGHSVRKCRATRCAICRRPHNAILHNEELIPEMSSAHIGYGSEAQTSGAATNNGTAKRSHEQVPSNRTAVQSYDPQQRLPYGNSATTMLAYESKGEVILATALVQMKDKCGQYHVARCLLDSGSQINIVTEDLVHRLKLERHSSTLSVQGVGDGNKRVRHSVSTYMKSCVNEFEIETDFYVMKTITCPQPRNHISVDNLGIPSNIELADPQFNKPQRIDILVGAQIFFDLLCIGQIKLGTELPILQKTLLGWIVSGRYGIERKVMALSFCVSTTNEENLLQELSERVQRFWELEWVPNCSTMTSEHLMCEKHFLNTATRSDDGRFEVRLPFKTDPKVLGHSYETAKRRLLALERRLSKNVEMKRMYTDFMKEYLLLGHMSQTNTENISLPHYFIPHQCVIRAQSTSTKLRVVFDASCKTSSQKSLNDILMVGPTIQNDLFTTLSKFRVNKYALTADITKMYRQVNVHKDDRKFQLILWRENCDMPIQTYELNTVTYGTGPAPFLAIRCLKEISHLFNEVYPLGSKIIATDFYVDDLLSGANDIDTLMQIRSEVIQILNACGFSLAKWHSNVKGFGSDESVMQLDVHDATFTRALGVNWKPQDDVIFFHLDNDFSNLPATKRNILSVSSRLFDPLGLLSPIIIKAKILLQQLWTNNLDWDESILQHLDTEWSYFKTVLTQINQICIPRFIGTTLNASVQIHGFADASMKAYGCCIYVVSRQGNDVTTRLFLAKSRVAPSKKIKTLPRLELCAAHLLAKLWSVANVNLSPFKIDDIFFWSDSEIVLHWVKTHPSMLSTFVGNRVAQISEYCEEAKWRYVPSAQNPADIVSRGCDVTELQNSDWLSGPDFLRHSVDKWPVNRFELSSSDLKLEMKKSTTTLSLEFKDEINKLDKSGLNNRSSIQKLNPFIQRYSTNGLCLSLLRVYWQERNSEDDMVRQRDKFRRDREVVEPQGSIGSSAENSREGDRVPFHSSTRTPLRRAVGGGGEVRQIFAVANYGQRRSNIRRTNYSTRRRGSRSQFEANSSNYRRPKRRSGTHSRPFVNRLRTEITTNNRRIQQQNEFIEALSNTFLAQGALLGCVATGLYSRAPDSSQVDEPNRQRQDRRRGPNPRGQSSTTEMANWQSRRRRTQFRQQSLSHLTITLMLR
ncbi:uncharacterized protein LOC142225150 [Haematobia irritans]|uniref:uncharacterized protein LOC142225150 n=1 Tax=Haematobia irritans TaxID=7368 RepID=UPI003F50B977